MRRHLSARRLVALALVAAGIALVASGLYIPAKAALAQILLERSWQRTKHGEAGARPWPWADVNPVAEIEIPRLRRRMVVLEGASGSAMAFAPGHMPNSAAIGARGTAIIAAHRDTHFRFLGRLHKADVILVTTADGRRTLYRVAESHVVRANASGLDPADSGTTGTRLALVTCYPFSGVFHSPWRYVVIADAAPAITVTPVIARRSRVVQARWH